MSKHAITIKGQPNFLIEATDTVIFNIDGIKYHVNINPEKRRLNLKKSDELFKDEIRVTPQSYTQINIK